MIFLITGVEKSLMKIYIFKTNCSLLSGCLINNRSHRCPNLSLFNSNNCLSFLTRAIIVSEK